MTTYTQCPHTVGDDHERDCCFPNCEGGWEAVFLKQRKEFNEAIDFAISDSEPTAFLLTWREGDWEMLQKDWPDFELPEQALRFLEKLNRGKKNVS